MQRHNKKQTNKHDIIQNNNEKDIFISLLAMLPLAASAEPVEVDKIWYELDEADHTAVVVASGDEPYAGAIEIPTPIYYDKNYYIVKSIGESAFEECTELTSITISEGIESMELGAFYHCCFLESVVIPNSVKKSVHHRFLSAND